MSDLMPIVAAAISPEHLAARAALYQVFSNLMAGPVLADMDSDDYWEATIEMLITGTNALPFNYQASALITLLQQLTANDKTQIKADYGRYFEVGSDGIKMPIREELSDEKHIGKKEELVRYYDYFGYQLEADVQWQPDHLALELEFVSFLIESQWTQTDAERKQSFLLAQRDFCQRHILSWVPALAENFKAQLAEHFYSQTLSACQRFVQTDFEWLQIQITQLEEV